VRCKEIMKRDIACVSPLDTVQVAAQRMRDDNVGFLPVCDQRRQVVGAVTDRDLAMRIVAEALPAHTLIRDVMTEEIVWCHPDDPLHKAQEKMARHRTSRILCTDPAGALVGVLSLSDLARHGNGTRAPGTLRRTSGRDVS
jgi:CBS domain-containing protein